MPGTSETTPRDSPARRTTPTSSPAGTATVGGAEHPGRLHALVVSDKLVATFPLPDHGEVKIGRSNQCEIMVDEPSISRVHATIKLGPPIVVRDLGSANGTRVRDQQIEPQRDVEILPGESIQVGSATLIVQRQVAPIRPRRLWTHDYFEVRLEEECARAARRSARFAVLRLACSSPAAETAHTALADLVRLSDVVGEYGPGEFEMLLVDTEPEEVELAINRIVGELARDGVSARVGVACYPRDGRTPDELTARAGAGVRTAPPSKEPTIRTEVVGDRAIQDLYALAARIANGTISVLILGETGVGKEVLAEKVHKLSPRAAKPYLRLNCAALSETLLESELFGHERGAFTGAVGTKQGLLETADGGTVFLDEVGELPLSIQVKLLRVIEERVVLRVGGLKPRPLDVRFLAATNRDLEAEIARGTFRLDLFYRLNGATLVIPPLRERLGEIPILARAFLANAARQANLAREPVLSDGALDALLQYSWPGNIRELRNMMERAVLLSGSGTIEPRHLSLEKMRVTFATASIASSTAPSTASPTRDEARTLDDRGEAVPVASPHPDATHPARAATVLRRGAQMTPEEERQKIEHALLACGGNQTRAAQMLGIGRRTLINRLREFGLARPRAKR